MNIFNGDCLKIISTIKNKVNLVCVDLPYGQTACGWDCPIDLKLMWVELKKVCSDDCIYVFYCTTRFGNSLINSNPLWFRYDLVWEKSRTLGFLSAKKSPLRKHEMIYIFSNAGTDDLKNERNLNLREYAKKVKSFINQPAKQIHKTVGNQGIRHFYMCDSTQFGLPTEKTYNILIEKYNLREMDGFREYISLKKEWGCLTYNPQKTKGKPYKSSGSGKAAIYGSKKVSGAINTGDRYPVSILRFNHPKKSLHPTQKPVGLCEWIINTYSNKGDHVLDFTMGSGSVGIACLNTGRLFSGIEKDQTIFKTARNRIIQCEIDLIIQKKNINQI
jgi:DNA modification methylase